MPAIVQVICSPDPAARSQRLLTRYRELPSAPIGTSLWLTPTHRALEALRPRLLEYGPVSLGAAALTIQDFGEELVRANNPQARPVPRWQQRLLLEELVAELHQGGRLGHFRGVMDTRGFTEVVFGLVAELKQHGIRPEALTAALTDLNAAHPNSVGDKEQQCAALYQAEYQRLVQHNYYDLEGCLWHACDLLRRGCRRPFDNLRVLFLDGFTDFTAAQKELLQALVPELQECWISLPDEAGAERAELFARPRSLLAWLIPWQPVVEYLEPGATAEALPAGLAHAHRELFRPARAVQRNAAADGLLCLECPGLVGEARMVARHIKELLRVGVPPDEILVVLRELGPYADLLREVFAAYDIPLDVEGAESLLRNPAVALLPRLLRLPDDDWPFAAVTALLRSCYFAPAWPAVQEDAEIAHQAEALLRLLAEPRGRDQYLRSAERWAQSVPPALEDEQAEESRRQKKHELAKKCLPFLRQFFHAWDDAPARGTLAQHLAWVRHLAETFGLTRAAEHMERDALALERLWEGLGQWLQLERRLHPAGRLLERGQFQRLLLVGAANLSLPRSPRSPGRVRILSAPLTRGLSADHVFLMGLAERSFPQLVAPLPLFDEAERQALRQAGLNIPGAADLLPGEMLLFYQVVRSARRRLVLSYPALDAQGQALLPSTFLTTLRDCFSPGAIPTQRRRMLIEGYDRDTPLSPAEERVQWACRKLKDQPAAVSPTLAANLRAAADMAHQRFACREHTAFDGNLSEPSVVAAVAELFTPKRILSPTALENYISCPFKFFLGNVLRLEPLEEPREDVESTERGLAFHRALARLHQQLRKAGVNTPAEEVGPALLQQLDQAVRDGAGGVGGAAEVLWRLEGERLKRFGGRYPGHWAQFVEPWLEKQVRPQPEFFEIAFGLPPAPGEFVGEALLIADDQEEVRISGRIDRVDVAELPDGGLGFWIIDYKTGRSNYYTAADLQEFRKLQLTLYALAVEQVLLAGREARPLGMAYWLVADTGPKAALPGGRQRSTHWLADLQAWPKVRAALCGWVLTLVHNIRRGQFALKPRSEQCTATCDFSHVCRISQSRSVVEQKTWQLPLPLMG